MAILEFLVSLAGATMLLLFAVRMVRTGIERRFGASFQRVLTKKRSGVSNSLIGVVLAAVMQSSAAVTLLVSGFVASGAILFQPGLVIVLGGDLGSALIIQLLSFDLDWLVPLLLAAGGWMFLKSDGRNWRQLGRIVLGIAFILVALRFLREAMDPIRDSAFLPAIANYLARDYITAFLVGAALAFVMHSSVAAVLICVTLVQIGAIPFVAGLSLVLGANMGSALIPVWLTQGMDIKGRRIPLANLVLRGVWAVIALFSVNLSANAGWVVMPASGQALVLAHITFNIALVILALPISGLVEKPMLAMFPPPPDTSGSKVSAPKSALSPQVLQRPTQTIAALKQELLRMAGLVEGMFRPTLGLFETGNPNDIKSVQAVDHQVNTCLSGIREFVAAIPQKGFGKENAKLARDLLDYAIRLEAAGDIVDKRLVSLVREKHQRRVRFSNDGWAELIRMHEACLANLKLATNLLLSDDLESARLLLLENAELKRAERQSRKRHLKRLQGGQTESFETSDIHLECLQAFREFNSHISSVAYPVLYRNGQLLETRLIKDMAKGEHG